VSGLRRTPNSFDERVPLAEALEAALGRDDQPSSLTAPVPAELHALINLARRVERSAQAVEPSDAFRLAARTRLAATMRASAAPALSVRPSASQARQPSRLRLAVSGWFARAAAVVSAVGLAGAATASASASALPGDSLYGLKQVTEQVALVTAADDAARQQVLVRQADTRLEETSRLLEQGRAAEAGQTAQRYGEVLERATAIVGMAEPVEPSLQTDRTRLSTLLAQAPAPARPGLQRALEAVDRGLLRSQRNAPVEVEAQSPRPRPAVVQQAPDVNLEPTSTSNTTASPTPARSATTGEPAPPKNTGESAEALQPHDAAEPQADQSRHDPAPEKIEPGRAPGGAASPVGPPERPASSVPAVDKSHGAPVTPVRPARSGRP
jgi:hypothetical protein